MRPIPMRTDIPSHEPIRDWFTRLPTDECDYITSKLGDLVHLANMRVNWDLLRNLIAHWDTTAFTFHFAGLDLAPTYEEYLTLADLPHRQGILPLQIQNSSRTQLRHTFGMGRGFLPTLMTEEGHVRIPVLLGLMYQSPESIRRDRRFLARVFILAFTGMILYPYTEDLIHARAVYLATAIIEERPFLINLLGETNFCLTELVMEYQQWENPSRTTFCPALLQAWFYLHIGVMAYSLRENRPPMPQIEMEGPFPVYSASEMQAFFEEITESDFYPRAPCGTPGRIIIGSLGSYYLQIMGLTGSSYYVPARVLHQFGGVPLPGLDRDYFYVSLHLDTDEEFRWATPERISSISDEWRNLDIQAIPPVPQNPALEDARYDRFSAQRACLVAAAVGSDSDSN